MITLVFINNKYILYVLYLNKADIKEADFTSYLI